MVMIVLMILMNIMWMQKVKMTMLLFSSSLLRHSSPLLSVAAQVYLSCRCPSIRQTGQTQLMSSPCCLAVPPLLLPIIPISHCPLAFPMAYYPLAIFPFPIFIDHCLFPIGHCVLPRPMAHRQLHIKN